MRYPPTFGFPCSVLLLLTLALPLTAQTTFQRTYGGAHADEGYSVAQTTDGGYIITGYTQSLGAGGADVYLVRTDATGDTLWTRTFGGEDTDQGYSVALTADGGYIVTGYTFSFGAGRQDIWLLKTDASGDTVWTRALGGTEYECGYSVAQTTDGGYIVAGYTDSHGAGNHDVYLVKTDASGDTVWTRAYGGTDYDVGWSVAQTADGGYIVTGYTYSFGAGSEDAWLIKTDANGDTMWTRTYGGTRTDRGRSVLQTTDGGYVIAGETGSSGAGSLDVWLIRTDVSGDTMWTRTYGGAYRDRGCSVAQTADNGYIIAGSTCSFGVGLYDVYLVKTDASGHTLWTRTFGDTNGDYGYSVRQTPDGGYVVAGRTSSFGAGWLDIYLIKTDSAGNAAAIAEPEPPVAHEPAPATIVRGVLRMPETEMTNAQYPMTLLDISGREVAKLQPGENDVRHLSPGVYFVQGGSTARPTKVIIQR